MAAEANAAAGQTPMGARNSPQTALGAGAKVRVDTTDLTKMRTLLSSTAVAAKLLSTNLMGVSKAVPIFKQLNAQLIQMRVLLGMRGVGTSGALTGGSTSTALPGGTSNASDPSTQYSTSLGQITAASVPSGSSPVTTPASQSGAGASAGPGGVTQSLGQRTAQYLGIGGSTGSSGKSMIAGTAGALLGWGVGALGNYGSSNLQFLSQNDYMLRTMALSQGGYSQANYNQMRQNFYGYGSNRGLLSANMGPSDVQATMAAMPGLGGMTMGAQSNLLRTVNSATQLTPGVNTSATATALQSVETPQSYYTLRMFGINASPSAITGDPNYIQNTLFPQVTRAIWGGAKPSLGSIRQLLRPGFIPYIDAQTLLGDDTLIQQYYQWLLKQYDPSAWQNMRKGLAAAAQSKEAAVAQRAGTIDVAGTKAEKWVQEAAAVGIRIQAAALGTPEGQGAVMAGVALGGLAAEAKKLTHLFDLLGASGILGRLLHLGGGGGGGGGGIIGAGARAASRLLPEGTTAGAVATGAVEFGAPLVVAPAMVLGGIKIAQDWFGTGPTAGQPAHRQPALLNNLFWGSKAQKDQAAMSLMGTLHPSAPQWQEEISTYRNSEREYGLRPLPSYLPGTFGGAVTPGNSAPSGPTSSPTSGPDARALDVVHWAEREIGVPYRWGGESPKTGFDCCLTAESYVQTVEGPTPIVDIKRGARVYAYEDGRLVVRTVAARSEPRRQRVYRLRTQHRSLRASGNHPFLRLTKTPGESPGSHGGLPACAYTPEWVHLEDLQRGDILVTLRKTPERERYTEYSDDYLWLLGIALADGHLSKARSSRINLCVFGAVREQVQACLERLIGKRATEHPSHGLYFHDAYLAACLREHGMDARSPGRQVPRELWSMDERQIRSFLDGYSLGDGSVNKRDHCIEYKASSEDLVRQVRNLYMILGDAVTNVSVIKRVRPIVIKGKTIRDAKPLYCFAMYPDLHNRGQSLLSKKAIRQHVDGVTFTPERVLGIDQQGVEDTYDIEVRGAHNFIAEGLVVHNSGLVQWAYHQAGVNVPRTSEQQQAAAQSVAPNDVQPGDLLFLGSPAYHVMMSIGGGRVVEAPHTGTDVSIHPFPAQQASSIGRFINGVGGMTGAKYGSSMGTGGSPTTGSVMSVGQSGDVGGSLFGDTSSTASLISALSALGDSGGGASIVSLGSSSRGASGSGGKSSHVPGFKPPKTGSSAAKAQDYAHSLLGKYHWNNPRMWRDLVALWNQESGWNPLAMNQSSGAYGIPQSLGHGRPYPLGDSMSAIEQQVNWGFRYIQGRYGNPAVAEAHERSHNWYEEGAWNVMRNEMAKLHAGEMVIPAQPAQKFREAMEQTGPQSQSAQVLTGVGGSARRAIPVTLQFYVQSGSETEMRQAAMTFKREVEKSSDIDLVGAQ